MRRWVGSLFLALALVACASDERGGDRPGGGGGGSGGKGGAGVDGGGGFPSGGSGGAGSGGAPSCEPSAATTGSHAPIVKDVLVTDSHSQRALAIRFDPIAKAWAIANVIESNGLFPLEVRRAVESGVTLTISPPVLAVDSSVTTPVNTFDPSLAAVDDSSRMLLVWADDRLGGGNGGAEIFGQFFDLTGSTPQKIGQNFTISEQPATDEWRPVVTFDTASRKFWVAWADDREFKTVPGGRFEYARPVDIDGTLGPSAPIGDKTTWQDGVRAAVGSAGPLFVWSEYAEDTEQFGRYRARLTSAPAGQLIELYKSGSLVPAPPAVAWDEKRCRFLAVWQETASTNAIDKQIWGQLLGPDGSVVKSRFQITTQPAGAGSPRLEYSRATQSFMLTFGSWEDSNAYVFELDGEGAPVGTPESLHDAVPAKGTYYHELSASDGAVLAITNDDYLRVDATLLGPK